MKADVLAPETAERGFIQTHSGRHFSLDVPEFHLPDIAHSLSLLCRFNGHCSRFYSVAEHSLLVARIMEDLDLGNPLEGLMHDAVEAYLSDVPAPFKQFLPDWHRLETRLDGQIRERYGLPREKTEGCRKADWMALFIEAHDLTADGGRCFADPLGLRPVALQWAGLPQAQLGLGYRPGEAANIWLGEVFWHLPEDRA